MTTSHSNLRPSTHYRLRHVRTGKLLKCLQADGNGGYTAVQCKDGESPMALCGSTIENELPRLLGERVKEWRVDG